MFSSWCLVFHLQYDADVTILDVDGNFALDHAPENSESREILQLHYSEKGRI